VVAKRVTVSTTASACSVSHRLARLGDGARAPGVLRVPRSTAVLHTGARPALSARVGGRRGFVVRSPSTLALKMRRVASDFSCSKRTRLAGAPTPNGPDHTEESCAGGVIAGARFYRPMMAAGGDRAPGHERASVLTGRPPATGARSGSPPLGPARPPTLRRRCDAQPGRLRSA
jgi:hypothetical protein